MAELEAEIRWHLHNGMQPDEHKANGSSLEGSNSQLEASSAEKRIRLGTDAPKVPRVCGWRLTRMLTWCHTKLSGCPFIACLAVFLHRGMH